jgi:hypothetical protein
MNMILPLLLVLHNDVCHFFFIIILVCEAIGIAATPGLWRGLASGDSEDDCGEADGM